MCCRQTHSRLRSLAEMQTFHMFSALLHPCPGQCDLTEVCKSEEELWGLDQILQLHHKLCPIAQPNFADAAGMKTQSCLSVFPMIQAGSLSSESFEINFAVVFSEFSSWILMLCIVSSNLPPHCQNSLGNSFVKNFIEMQTDINVGEMKETLSNFCEWTLEGLTFVSCRYKAKLAIPPALTACKIFTLSENGTVPKDYRKYCTNFNRGWIECYLFFSTDNNNWWLPAVFYF